MSKPCLHFSQVTLLNLTFNLVNLKLINAMLLPRQITTCVITDHYFLAETIFYNKGTL